MPLNRYERVSLMAASIYGAKVSTDTLVSELCSKDGATYIKSSHEYLLKSSIEDALELSKMVKSKCEQLRAEENAAKKGNKNDKG